MNFKKISFLLPFGLIFLTLGAEAGPRFSIVGAGDYSKGTETHFSGTMAAKLGYGGGALVEFRLGAKAGLEVGALYLQRKMDNTVSGTATTITFTAIEAPVILRFWLNPMISLGAGGYYAQGYDKIKDSTGGAATYPDYSLLLGDYGVVGVLGFNFKLGNSVALLIDGRYTLGLADTSSITGAAFKYTDMQGLVGLRFGMGSK